MSECTLAMLCKRMDMLERQNRRLKVATLGAVAVVSAILLMGTASPRKVVKAEEFVLSDAQGRQRALLRMSQWGPSLDLRDEKGTIRATLHMDDNGPGVSLLDAKGKERVALDVEEGPVLALFDDRGEQRVSLGVQEPGDKTWPEGAALFLFDQEGKPRVTLDASAKGPTLTLHDASGKVLSRLPRE